MKNITHLFKKYREAARHLRNTYLVPSSKEDYQTIDGFDEICFFLFKHMINSKVEIYQEDWSRLGQALKEFKGKNGCYPKKIIIYRDGVGSSQ